MNLDYFYEAFQTSEQKKQARSQNNALLRFESDNQQDAHELLAILLGTYVKSF